MPESTFEREVLDRLKTIEVKMDSYVEIKEQVYENQRESLVLKGEITQLIKDVTELKDKNKWLARTIGAAIIGIVVSAIVFAIKIS